MQIFLLSPIRAMHLILVPGSYWSAKLTAMGYWVPLVFTLACAYYIIRDPDYSTYTVKSRVTVVLSRIKS